MFYSKDVDKMSADIREARDPYKDNIILNGGNPEYLEANNLTLSETPANWLKKPVPKWKSFDVENVAEEEEEKEEKDEEALIEEFTSGTMNRGFSVLWNYEENGTYPFRDATNILYDSGVFFPKINGKPIFDPEALEVEKSRWGLENVALFSFNITKGIVDLARFHELDDRTQLAYFQALDLYNTKLPMLYYDDREDGNEPWYKQTAWDGIFRAVHGIASDPATYIGLGIYNQVPKLTANLSGKKITTEILKKMLSPTALAVYEGGTWTGVANYQAQQIEIEGAGQNPIVQDKIEQAGEENPYKTELDKGELAFNIGLGSIIGPAFEGIIKTPQAYRAIKKQIDDYRKKNNIPETKEIKNMVMLHNTGEEAIINYQELGGIPSPSLAVTKADQRFEGFGSIQLIARPEKFDPSTDPKNVIYGADAYSPRMPRGENRFLDNADDLIETDYRPLMDKYDLNEQLHHEHNLRDFVRPSMITQIKFLDELGYEKEIREALDVDVDLKDVDPRLRGETNLRELFDSVIGPTPYHHAENLDTDFGKFLKAEREKYTDPNKTFSAINKKVQRRIDQISERLNDPDVQRNNDLYESLVLELEDLEFNKKWEDVPYTLENILDNMVEEVQRGGEKGFGSGGPNKVRAVASKSYKDLDEVKRDKGRIIHQDDVDAIKANKTTTEDGSFIGQESDLEYNWDRLQRHVDRFSEGGVEQDSLYYAMIDAIRSDQSDEAIKEAFQYIGGEQYGPDMIQRVRNMIGILREVDVPYFEAKPQRVVDLSEFGGAIVPDNTDPKVIKILEDHGIEIQYIDEMDAGAFSGDGTMTVEAKARKDFFKKFFFTVPPAVMTTDAILDENNRQAE